MCGIAGIYFKNPEDDYMRPKEIESMVDWLFCGIEHRGTHATGIAVQYSDGESLLEKSDMPASRFIFWRRDLEKNPRSILLHTRLHTKGKPENLLNNHPVQYKNIMMVHNGHISNDDELFKDEELERFAEVDSEIIPALLHKHGMVEPKTALEKMQGGFAIAAIDEENPGSLLLAKGPTSPLVYMENSAMWIWASEGKAIKDALEYGFGYDVKESELKTMAYGQYILLNGENHTKDHFKPSYKAYVHNSYTYQGSKKDQCDGCFSYFDEWKLNKIKNDFYCDRCENQLFDITQNGERIPKAPSTKKLSKKERKRLRKEARRRIKKEESQRAINPPNLVNVSELQISDVLDDEHWFVCEMVAEFFGTNKEFVDMVLFSELTVEDDPMLSTIYTEFDDKYAEFLNEVRDGTDVVLNRISNTTNKSRNFPVGF